MSLSRCQLAHVVFVTRNTKYVDVTTFHSDREEVANERVFHTTENIVHSVKDR